MNRALRLAMLAALLCGALVGGAPARADQTVRHDGPDGAPRISLIGDSTLTGVRWYDDYGALRKYSFVFSAESCRRTVEQSCISREGYRSANVLAAMRSLDGELGELLVVMSGYNDPEWSIDAAIDGVVDEARSQGVDRVIWLTLRTSGVDYSDPQEQTSTDTFRSYNARLIEAAAELGGYLQVADWATYSGGAGNWFEYDGVHLTAAGVDALTTYITGVVDRVLAGENISPAEPPWSVLVPGDEGEVVAEVQAALAEAGIHVPGGADGVYGGDTMGAVAEYQRTTPGLQVTGAVDEKTARALGVYGAPTSTVPPTTAPPVTSALVQAAAPAAALADGAADDQGGPATPQSGPDGSRTLWFVIAAVVVGAWCAVVARRRYVVARRAARRWARVHPATSPLHTVAELRRAGVLPERGAGAAARREETASS